MSKILVVRLLMFFSIIFSLISCEKDKTNTESEKSKIEFSINISGKLSEELLKSASIKNSEIKYVIFSIVDLNNELIYAKEKIELFNFNGYFISEPVVLSVGDYYLSEFLVMDDANNVLYAAPKKESLKSNLVKEPLPIKFKVKKDYVNKLTPDVVSMQNSVPEDFGYTTFSFNIVETIDFLISVFVYNDTIENFELTDAYLTIENNSTVLFSGKIKPVTNFISISDDYSSYKITINKLGYFVYDKTFSADSLKKYDKSPLIIILEKNNIKYSSLYAIHFQGTTFKIAHIDCDIGNILYSPVIKGLESFSSSAYNYNTNRYIVIGRGKSNVDSIKIINPETGIIEKTIGILNHTSALKYNPETNKVYGLHWQNTTFKIATIDCENSSITYSPVIEKLEAFVYGGTTYDPIHNRYIVNGLADADNSNEINIKIINPDNGVIEKIIEVEKNTSELEYSAVDNKLYAINWQYDTNTDTQTCKIITIDCNTNAITNKAIIKDLNVFACSSSTYDSFNNRYILIGRLKSDKMYKDNVLIINPENGIIEKIIPVEKYTMEPIWVNNY